MHRLIPVSLILLTGLVCFGWVPEALRAEDVPAATPIAPWAQRIDAYFTAAVDSGASCAILVARDGEVELTRGYGLADRAAGKPITDETIFTIGSLTKQFTGAAIMKLVEQGKLDVLQTLADFFPDVPADREGITVHQLLTHSAGFPGGVGSDDDWETTRDDFVRAAFAAELGFDPGTSYRYSNVGYTLLAMILEDVSGMNYEAFLREYLFLPAGMTHTGYKLPDWDGAAFAHGYYFDADWGTLPARYEWDAHPVSWNLKGNGGILSNVRDLYRWHVALESGVILPPELKALYEAPHNAENPEGQSHYAYGWVVFPTARDTKLLAHNGSNGIFFADYLRFVEEDVVVIYLTNFGAAQAHGVASDIERMIFEDAYEPEPVPMLAPSLWQHFYNMACHHALAGRAGEAVEMLRVAIEMEPEARGHARDDADFEPVREREEFRELVGEE